MEEKIRKLRLLDFIRKGTSPYHVVREAGRFLEENGFQRLSMGELWELREGGRYYAPLYGTALFAFTIGEGAANEALPPFRIAAAHIDYPCFRVKPRPELRSKGYLKLNVEPYGGMTLGSWLDRPLSVAGKVTLRSESVFAPRSRLLDLCRPVLVIPSLAIHMNRDVNKGMELNPQTHMLPILAAAKENSLGKKEGSGEREDFFLRFLARELDRAAEAGKHESLESKEPDSRESKKPESKESRDSRESKEPDSLKSASKGPNSKESVFNEPDSLESASNKPEPKEDGSRELDSSDPTSSLAQSHGAAYDICQRPGRQQGSPLAQGHAQEITPDDILDFDLTVYNAEEGCLLGMDEDFISSPRLDNLTSVVACLNGIVGRAAPGRISVVALYDNEEIGSHTKQGADSSIANILLERIYASLGKSPVQLYAALMGSFMLSVDVAHGFHPNYPEASDPTNVAQLGEGVVLKLNSTQRYATDTEAIGAMQQLCEAHRIPYQKFVNRSDKKGGGTLGSLISSWLPIRTADLGAPILSMHSARELMGKKDQESLERLVAAFFQEE